MLNFKVLAIKRNDYKEWLLHKHYAHRIPSVSYAFGLYDIENILQGVCTFGLPAAKEICLCCGKEYKEKTIELNRLVKNDGLGKNVQSFFVARCFKLLPKPMVIVSYSDPNYGHYGYSYQALNFHYTGEGREIEEYTYNGKQFTGRHLKKYWFYSKGLPFDERKTINKNFLLVGGSIKRMKSKKRYVMFLGNKYQKRDMLKKLKWNILPYPKGENKRYDTSYSPKTQGLLF